MSQSNGQHDWDELLSAYADGEVSPSERATVEALLASTPGARQTLDELRSLSRAVRTLPTPEPPANFVAVVKSRIPAGVTPAAASAKRRFRGYRREWFAGLSAIAMTILAAGLLSVQLQNQTAFIALSGSADDMSAVPIAGRPEMTLELRSADRGRVSGGVAGKRLASVIDPSPTERELLRNDLADTPALGTPLLTCSPARSETMLRDLTEADLLAHRQPAASVDDVERLREVLPYLRLQDENGQSVGNVELVVVDAQRVANQFQVLLMQNGVTTVDARTIDFDANVALAETARKKTEAGQPTVVSDDLLAVYTEAPGEPLSKTLEELIQQREILSLRLQPPLQLAAEESQSTADKSGVAERKLNLKQITDAYFTQQLEDEAALWAEDFDTVSAADAIAVARGEPADNSLRYYAEQLAQRSASRFGLSRMARAASGPAPQPAQQSIGRGVKANSEINENVASFNTLVKLPVPMQEGESVNPAQQRANLDVTQTFRRSRPIGAPAAAQEDLTQMRSRFARAAPDSVRVLFVLHPVANSTTPAPAAMPAGR